MLEEVEQVSPATPPGDRRVIDVRQMYETEGSPLEEDGAQNVPLEELRERCEAIPKDQPLVAVCAKGLRSAESVRILKEKGFSDVKYLGGGLTMRTSR
jgi:rhodanese-related sulfurtransferase